MREFEFRISNFEFVDAREQTVNINDSARAWARFSGTETEMGTGRFPHYAPEDNVLVKRVLDRLIRSNEANWYESGANWDDKSN